MPLEAGLGTTWGQMGTELRSCTQYSLFEDLLHHRQTDPQWQAEQRLPRGVGDFGVADTDPLGQAEVIHFRLGDRRGRGYGCRGPFLLLVRPPSPTTRQGGVEDRSSISTIR